MGTVNSLQTTFQVVIMTCCAVGIIVNVFILVIGYLDWATRKKLPNCYMIVSCLSSSRLLLQGTVLYSTLCQGTRHWNVLRVQSALLVLSSTACLWFAACLSAFYCAKIATFTQRHFLLMKLRISGMVPYLLLGSMLVSLISSVPFIWTDFSVHLCNSTRSSVKNTTSDSTVGNISYFKVFIVYLTWMTIPLLFFTASSTLLIASLWRHTKQMRRNMTGFKDLSTQVHSNAIKTLISFLVLYFCSFVDEILLGIPSCLTRNRWKHSICSFIAAVCPSIHSILLIFFNVRLKQTFKGILLSMRCHGGKACS
ncbi:taste receptor type 2 member 40-like [Anolis carolinensis]|uniref:taste receptor type 2 member 40-like n=1 Tax=Anolis carolinensis TaxID=28377 RepID=UPI002F2B672B